MPLSSSPLPSYNPALSLTRSLWHSSPCSLPHTIHPYPPASTHTHQVFTLSLPFSLSSPSPFSFPSFLLLLSFFLSRFLPSFCPHRHPQLFKSFVLFALVFGALSSENERCCRLCRFPILTPRLSVPRASTTDSLQNAISFDRSIVHTSPLADFSPFCTRCIQSSSAGSEQSFTSPVSFVFPAHSLPDAFANHPALFTPFFSFPSGSRLLWTTSTRKGTRSSPSKKNTRLRSSQEDKTRCHRPNQPRCRATMNMRTTTTGRSSRSGHDGHH